MAKEFKGVWIPKAMYQDKALNPTDKLIMSDIFTLGEYYTSNETIALEVGVSRATASRAITNLIDKGYITKYFDGRNRRLKLTHQPAQIDSPGGSNSVSRKLKLTQQEAQIDSAAGSNCVTSIQDSIQPSIHISKEVVYPFNEIEFIEAWKIWIQERKEKQLRNYTQRGEQSALHNLQKISGDDYKKAIQIINNSITHGWQGLFALKEQKTKRPKLDYEAARAWACGENG